MELLQDVTQVVKVVNGVGVLQYPYVYTSLPKLLENVKNYEDMEELAGVIEDITHPFIREHHTDKQVMSAYFASSKTPSSEAGFYNGASLFYEDFYSIKADKFKDTNRPLYNLIKCGYIRCGLDCFFFINGAGDKLVLIDEGYREDTKSIDDMNVIDITECIYKEIKRHTGAQEATFKDFLAGHAAGTLQDILANILWDFMDGKDTMTIKSIKTAEELFS